MPSSSNKPSNRPPRVRTAAQLERKRILDRESQRINRQRNKECMKFIESELNELRQEFSSALAKLERLSDVVNIHHLPASQRAGTRQIPVTSPGTAVSPSGDQGNPAVLSLDSQEDAQKVSIQSIMNPIWKQMEPGEPDQTPRRYSSGRLAYLPPDNSYQLSNGAGLYQSICVPTSEDDNLSLASKSFPSPVSSGMTAEPTETMLEEIAITECLCGVTHINAAECMEYRSFQLLLNTHVAIHQNPVTAQLYPCTPKISSLLLLENESNPIVEVLGHLIKRCRPPLLADSIAVYLVMYRLFRWRVNPIPETYKGVPPFYRPSILQRSRPHPICIDFIAWPGLRETLITNFGSIEKLSFTKRIANAITVEWPHDQEVLIADPEGDLMVNPLFEEHIGRYSNWKMRRWWAEEYPHLSHLVNLTDN